jgi:hypothetical protein
LSHRITTSEENVLACFKRPYSLLLFAAEAISSCLAGWSICFWQAEKTKAEMIESSIHFLDKTLDCDFMMINF